MIHNRSRLLVLCLSFSGFPALSWTQTLSSETLDPGTVVTEVRRNISQRYSARITAEIYSEWTWSVQPVQLLVEFDMDTTANTNKERSIRNLHFALELQEVGQSGMPGYTLRALGPDSRTDFFPPDPVWWTRGGSYAEEDTDGMRVFIRAPANIELSAAGTALDAAITRLDNGWNYGAKAFLEFEPSCAPDLKTCRMGALSGIKFRRWGYGWAGSRYPDFRLISEETFSLDPIPQG